MQSEVLPQSTSSPPKRGCADSIRHRKLGSATSSKRNAYAAAAIAATATTTKKINNNNNDDHDDDERSGPGSIGGAVKADWSSCALLDLPVIKIITTREIGLGSRASVGPGTGARNRVGGRSGGPEDDGDMEGCKKVEGGDCWESHDVAATDARHGFAHGVTGCGGGDNDRLMGTRHVRDGVSNGDDEYNQIERAAGWRSTSRRDTDEVIAIFETMCGCCLFVG